MSIIKSTNSGKKLYWNVQIDKLSKNIYSIVKELPDNITRAVVYYDVPIIRSNNNGYYKKSFVRNKILFFKDIIGIEFIKRRLTHAFEGSLSSIDNFVKEDIDLDKIEIKIER